MGSWAGFGQLQAKSMWAVWRQGGGRRSSSLLTWRLLRAESQAGWLQGAMGSYQPHADCASAIPRGLAEEDVTLINTACASGEMLGYRGSINQLSPRCEGISIGTGAQSGSCPPPHPWVLHPIPGVCPSCLPAPGLCQGGSNPGNLFSI